MSHIPALDRLGDALEAAVAREQAARAQARRRRRRVRWLGVGLAAAAGLAVLLGVVPRGGDGGGPLRVDPASAEVTVRDAEDAYVVRIGNVLADPEAVRQALRRHDLDVQIRFLPTSPSLVGRLVASYGDDQTNRARVRWEYGKGNSVDSDFLAVRIPLDYRGRLGLDFGRRARPGEQYTSAALSAELPGEALHCAGVAGRRVREVLATLDRRGVYAIWRDPGNRTVPVGQVLDRWVASTIPWAPGQVLFMTAQQPPDRGELTPQYLALLRRGCPGG
jgi:hypothetical protein